MSAPAVKHDGGKPRMDLVPADALLVVGDVMAVGAAKYGDRNWERGLDYGRLYAAAQRHLLAWHAGDDLDPETGRSHLAHAVCCTLMLLASTMRGIGLDDRRSA